MNKVRIDQYFEREYFTLHEGKKRYIYFLCNLIKKYNVTKVLDIGCGYGFFLEQLDNMGYQTSGIDVSKTAIEESKKRTKANLILGSADHNLPFSTNFFDAVTMFDVIEHVQNYQTALKEIYRVLKPGGYAFIITLNSHSLLRIFLGKSWSWYKDPTHKHMFSTAQIEKSLRNYGFVDINTKTFFNLNLAGETTKILGMVRRFGKILFIPKIGDSILAIGKAKK